MSKSVDEMGRKRCMMMVQERCYMITGGPPSISSGFIVTHNQSLTTPLGCNDVLCDTILLSCTRRHLLWDSS